MINWLRDPSKDQPPTIRSGLVELCEYVTGELRDSDSLLMYEIGSFAGESAEVFAEYFDRVHCVDPWTDSVSSITGGPDRGYNIIDIEHSFDERAAAAGNIIKHKCRSVDIVTSVIDESLDFVYIDANHSYDFALQDMRAWWPKVRPGAFFGGHDFADAVPPHPAYQVIRALTDFCAENPYTQNLRPLGRFSTETYNFRVFPDTSWVIRKSV